MMKLNIQLFAEGSTTLIGTLNGAGGAYGQFYAVRSYTQDEENATTKETIKLYLKRVSSYASSYNSAAPYTIKEGTKVLKSGNCSFNFGNMTVGSSVLLATYERTLEHEEDGTYEDYTLNATITTGTSLGNGSISKVVSTPTISTSYLVSISNLDISNNNVLSIVVGTKENTNYTYDLSYKIGEDDDEESLEGIIDENLTTSPKLWELSEELITNIKNKMSNTAKIKIIVYCITKKDGIQIGTIKQSTANILITEIPSNSGATYEEQVSIIKALTNSEYIVKELSKLKFNLNITAPDGTTMKKYYLGISDGKGNTREISSDTNEIIIENIVENIDGNTTLYTYGIDNRDNKSETWLTDPIPFIDYIKAEYINTECIVKRDESNIDKVSVNLKANFFEGQIGTTDNEITLGYKYKEKGATDYTVGTSSLSLNTDIVLAEIFDHAKNYELVFTINDLIYTGSEMTKQVAKSQYIMLEHENGVDFLNATIMGEQIALVSQLCKDIEEFGEGYIRYKKDETLGYGIQICWGSITVPSGSTAIGVFGADPGRNITGATFPKAFSEIPKTAGLVARASTSAYWGIGCQYQANSTTKLGNICILRSSTTNATIAGTIDWSAIGKWE